MLRVPLTAMPKADALASIAYLSLAARGKHTDPTLHDITVAIVQAAPLLDLNGDLEGVTTEIEAVRMVCERHDWRDKKVVILPDRNSPKRNWRRPHR